jgi:hypothetical protein
MELTQTLNQKETAQLLSGFLGNLDNHEKPFILYKYMGIKLDKPFFVDIHEGSFTTNSLLKKYPLSDNQMMFIFVLSEHYVYNYKKGSMCFEHYFKVTGVTTKGRIFTSHTNKDNILSTLQPDQYYSTPCVIFTNKKDFDRVRNIAEKTLIVISDKSNIVPVSKRHTCEDLDYTIPAHEGKEPFEARVTSVHRGKSDVIRFIISGRDKYKVSTVRSTYLYYSIDPSGYNIKYFKQRLLSELDKRKRIKSIGELVSIDYISDMNKLLDETVLLKNMALAELINIDTADTDIASNLLRCTRLSYEIINRIQDLMDDFKRVTEEYNNGDIEDIGDLWRYDYLTPKNVERSLENFMKSISDVKQKLFDELHQTNN